MNADRDAMTTLDRVLSVAGTWHRDAGPETTLGEVAVDSLDRLELAWVLGGDLGNEWLAALLRCLPPETPLWVLAGMIDDPASRGCHG